MLSPTSRDLNLVVSHTTAAASSVSDWVARHYGLPVQQCYLIRRNLNDNYAVRATSMDTVLTSMLSAALLAR